MLPSVTKAISGLGLGAAALSALLAMPISAAVSLGADHFRPSLDKQIYNIRSFFRSNDPDRIIMYRCDYATSGNLITLHNQMNAGSSSSRLRQGMKVTSVAHGEETREISDAAGSIGISGEYGYLAIFRSGFYTYISGHKSPKASHTETFQVKMVNDAGVEENVTLTVLVYETNKTANKMADYGNQVHGPNSALNGKRSFQTALLDGAMLIGWENDDVLIASDADDSMFGWNGRDHLKGLAGDDLIAGEWHSNTLEGGRGADRFLIHSTKLAREGGEDTILDFSVAEGDVLDLSPLIDAAWPSGLSDWRDAAWVEASEDFLDVFVRPAPEIDEVEPGIVARLKAHGDFDPTEININTFVRDGFIQF